MIVDYGSSSCRASIVDENWTVLESARLAASLTRDDTGKAEASVEDVWETIRRAVHRLGPGTKGIDAMGVSTIFGYVFLDVDDRPIGGATTWYDARAAQECLELQQMLGTDRLVRLSGRLPSPEWLAPLLMWTKRHEPERLERTVSVIGIKDEIVRRLTGVPGTDLAHQDYSMLWDVAKGLPASEVVDAVGIGRAPLPEATPAHATAGTLLPEVALDLGLPADIPVCRGSSDGTAAMYGTGVLKTDNAALVAGTTDVLMRFTPDFPTPDPRLSVNRGMEGGVLVGGATASSTGAVETVCRLLGLKPHEAFDALSQEEGSDDLVVPLVFPGFFGERAPYWDKKLTGAVLGLREDSRPLDILRGTVEGTGYRLGVLLESMGHVATVSVTGGAGGIAVWNQIRADTLGYPLRQLTRSEATTIGVAMFCRAMTEGTSLGALTPGLFQDAIDFAPRRREYHRKRAKHFQKLAAAARMEE